MSEITSITDLQQDSRNANKGTKRGVDSVEQSLRKYGTGRSILVDVNGKIIAGNKTALSAESAGLLDVIVIPSDGTKLIVVQRTDLDLETDAKAKALAVADNRTAELGLEWDTDVLKDLSTEIDLQPFFTSAELAEMTAPDAFTPGAPGPETLEGRYRQQYGVICICKDEADQRTVYEKLTGQGLECRVVVT
jgi:hypothetical protein